MKPIPIPDDLIPDGYRRITVGAPPGLEDTIAPVEALVPTQAAEAMFGKKYVMLIAIEGDDWKHLAASKNKYGKGLLYLQLYGELMQPFSIDVVEFDNGEFENQEQETE